MKILVTGGAGYIGSACVDRLVKAGHFVAVFDDLSTGQSAMINKDAEFIEGSLIELNSIMKACEKYPFDAVMHFAAKKSVGESETNPSLYFANNVVGSLNLLLAIEKNKIPKLIFSSTAAVYSPSSAGLPVTEQTKTAPVSVYGSTKLMVEEMIQAYKRAGKLENFSILRYFNVAGDAGINYKEHNSQNVFSVIADTLGTDKPFFIFGTDYNTLDGTGVRDYIHLKDLVEAHILALESPKSAIYNIGTGTGYTVRQLVEAFNARLDKPLNVKESARRQGDVPVMVADASLAKSELGWQPTKSLEDMVEDTLRIYQ